jgi:hypothetical protein
MIVVRDDLHYSLPGVGARTASTFSAPVSTAAFSDLRYCNQAEANEATEAQIAAQSPSDKKNAAIHDTSLVSARATSRLGRSRRDSARRNRWASSGRSDKKLLSISPPFIVNRL